MRPAIARVKRLARRRTTTRQPVAEADHSRFRIEGEHIGGPLPSRWRVGQGNLRSRRQDVIDFPPVPRGVARDAGDQHRAGQDRRPAEPALLIGAAIPFGERLAVDHGVLATWRRIDARPAQGEVGRRPGAHGNPRDQPPGNGSIVDGGGQVAHPGFERVESGPGGQAGGGRQGEFHDAGLQQRVGVGARGQGEIGGGGPVLGVARQAAFHGGTLKAEDRGGAAVGLRADAAIGCPGLRHEAERQLAPPQRRAQRSPGIIARLLVDVATEQGDPEGAVDTGGKINGAARGHGQRFIQRQVDLIWRPAAVGGVKQVVVVAELLGR